jgi:hypothetical protein
MSDAGCVNAQRSRGIAEVDRLVRYTLGKQRYHRPLDDRCGPRRPALQPRVLRRSRCSDACRQSTDLAPMLPPVRPHRERRTALVKDSGWLSGAAVESHWRLVNTSFSCTGNLTHPLPEGEAGGGGGAGRGAPPPPPPQALLTWSSGTCRPRCWRRAAPCCCCWPACWFGAAASEVRRLAAPAPGSCAAAGIAQAAAAPAPGLSRCRRPPTSPAPLPATTPQPATQTCPSTASPRPAATSWRGRWALATLGGCIAAATCARDRCGVCAHRTAGSTSLARIHSSFSFVSEHSATL